VTSATTPASQPPDDSPDSSAITIRLEGFEGPLDLLLYLIKREELDIRDIPIARVTEQYLEYLGMMKDLNINLAGDWLVMASTLIYIKSRMLLPPDPVAVAGETGPEADPRSELVYQLLEHQKFKNAAQMLYTREEVENAVWHRPPEEAIEGEGDLVAATLFDVIKAFHAIVTRFDAVAAMEVINEAVSVEERMSDLRKLLLVHDTVLFSSFFAAARSRPHLIATFLAILELVRLREVWLYQKEAFDEIYITRGKSEVDTAAQV
jgi:segregation and condensation protein A